MRPANRRKTIKKGLHLTVMVVGNSGLGRSTFVNTLCGEPVFARDEPDLPTYETRVPEATIESKTIEMEEDGVKVTLQVVDVPGFGEAADTESYFESIRKHIEEQYDEVLAEESRIKRNPKFYDNRIHALLYFIAPTGHSLREIDIELMTRLGTRVNIIPVVAKADSLTPDELATFKKRVLEDISYHDIHIYDFPFDPEEDDEETIQENTELRALLPFAVIGAEDEYTVNGRKVRGRKYPWGVVEVDNVKHCDFTYLRNALLGSHLSDLKEVTHDVLYENWRTEKLSRVGGDGDDDAQRLLREEQLQKEAEKLREKEAAISKEMMEKRQELLAKEEALRNLESRLTASQESLAQQAQAQAQLSPPGSRPH